MKQGNRRNDIPISASTWPATRIHRFGVGQSIPAGGGYTQLNNMTAEYDPMGWSGGATPKSTITVQVATNYLLEGWCYWNTGLNTAGIQFDIRINGTRITSNVKCPTTSATGITAQFLNVVWPLAIGDVVDLAARHNAGAPIFVDGCGLIVEPYVVFT